jgi:Tol biopolymer transport system component
MDSDGLHVIYSSNSGGNGSLYSRLADSTGTPERVTNAAESISHFPHSMTRDGKWLVFSENTPQVRRNLMILPTGNPGAARRLMTTPFVQQNGVVSPGRPMAGL